MDNANDIKEDPYKDGYTNEESFKTGFKEGNAYYMIFKAIFKRLMIIINY